MLDRVVSLEPLQEGTGLKAVSAADCPVPEGSPTAPALPGPLVLHGLCALAELVLEEPGKGPPVLEAVEEATFTRAVRPGEVLSYKVSVQEAGEEKAVIMAEATVQGEEVARARLLYRRREEADDPLAASWRGLRRSLLSGEDPPILR